MGGNTLILQIKKKMIFFKYVSQSEALLSMWENAHAECEVRYSRFIDCDFIAENANCRFHSI